MQHVHYFQESGALCGALNNKAMTCDARGVTCPLCIAILDGRALAHAAVAQVERRLTARLIAVQRDPAVRLIAGLVHRVMNAEKDVDS